MAWLHALRHKRYGESTLLAERLDRLSAAAPSRSLAIVLSDLHQPGAVKSLKRLSQRHDCVVLELQDPAERGRLRGGFFRGQEAETGERFVAHGRSRWFALQRPTPAAQLTRAGIDHLLLALDRPVIAPLQQLLRRRGGWLHNTR